MAPRLQRQRTSADIVVTRRNSSGQVGQEVYRVVKGQIPSHLKEPLVEPFTQAERDEIFQRVGCDSAQEGIETPIALWVLGPPAVGKTTMVDMKAREFFGGPSNAVLVDGSEFRQVHKGFRMVAKHGQQNNVVYHDAWSLFKATGYMDTMKNEVLERAISRRQNLMIPEAAMNVDRITSQTTKLVEHGYKMHLICLWAPKSELSFRGRLRAVRDGKLFSTKSYEKSCTTTAKVAEVWQQKNVEGDPHYGDVVFYDMTVLPSRPVHYEEFQRLTKLSDEEADTYALACQAQLDVIDDDDNNNNVAATKESRENSAARTNVSESASAIAKKGSKELRTQTSSSTTSSTIESHSGATPYLERMRAQVVMGRMQGFALGFALGVGLLGLLIVRRRRHVLK